MPIVSVFPTVLPASAGVPQQMLRRDSFAVAAVACAAGRQ